MNKLSSWQRFILVWLGSSLISYLLLKLSYAVGGIPHWFDVLYLSIWIVLAARWLPKPIQQTRNYRIAQISAVLVIGLVIWIIWYWIAGESPANHLWQTNEDGWFVLAGDALSPIAVINSVLRLPYIIEQTAVALIGSDTAIQPSWSITGLSLLLFLLVGLLITILAFSVQSLWQIHFLQRQTRYMNYQKKHFVIC